VKAVRKKEVELQGIGFVKQVGFKPGVKGERELWMNRVVKQKNSAKANSTLDLLRRNLHHCPEKLRELAYISLVRSGLEYCAAVWNPHKITAQLALKSVQRRAARFTKRDYSYQSSVSQMLQDLQWILSRKGDARSD